MHLATPNKIQPKYNCIWPNLLRTAFTTIPQPFDRLQPPNNFVVGRINGSNPHLFCTWKFWIRCSYNLWPWVLNNSGACDEVFATATFNYSVDVQWEDFVACLGKDAGLSAQPLRPIPTILSSLLGVMVLPLLQLIENVELWWWISLQRCMRLHDLVSQILGRLGHNMPSICSFAEQRFCWVIPNADPNTGFSVKCLRSKNRPFFRRPDSLNCWVNWFTRAENNLIW